MIRVLLAEDMHLVRGALVALLADEQDIDVVAELKPNENIVRVALGLAPDVAVIDVDLPGEEGLTAAAELQEKLPDCRALLLTGLPRPGQVRRALATRALGFIVKDSPPARLADAIRRVSRGERVVDPSLAAMLLDADQIPLTGRDLDVLRIAAEGSSATEIATELCLSVGTVRNYLTGIIRKTGGRNLVDAIRIASRSGWL